MTYINTCDCKDCPFAESDEEKETERILKLDENDLYDTMYHHNGVYSSMAPL